MLQTLDVKQSMASLAITTVVVQMEAVLDGYSTSVERPDQGPENSYLTARI